METEKKLAVGYLPRDVLDFYAVNLLPRGDQMQHPAIPIF